MMGLFGGEVARGECLGTGLDITTLICISSVGGALHIIEFDLDLAPFSR